MISNFSQDSGISIANAALHTYTASDGEFKLSSLRNRNKQIAEFMLDPAHNIKSAIQMGIKYSIDQSNKVKKRDLVLSDFGVVQTIPFNRDGAFGMAPHNLSNFEFVIYAPIAFRSIRDFFRINCSNYLQSICGHDLREISNPGASGSVFYISSDDLYIIKTLQDGETSFLQKLLPEYFISISHNKKTLLPNFYGLYGYKGSGQKIHFVVMNNILPSHLKFVEKYDLKGSRYKRKASVKEKLKRNPTLKDLDFIENYPDGIWIDAVNYFMLKATIESDCKVLQSFRIMDYSLLMAIHRPTTTNPNDSPSMRESRSSFIDSESLAPISRGIRAQDSKGNVLIVYCGIIDILQHYRFKKKLELFMKGLITKKADVSVQPPGFYAERFDGFVTQDLFKKLPARRNRKDMSLRSFRMSALDTDNLYSKECFKGEESHSNSKISEVSSNVTDHKTNLSDKTLLYKEYSDDGTGTSERQNKSMKFSILRITEPS